MFVAALCQAVSAYRGTADLFGTERFEQFAETRRREDANVDGKFRERCAEPGERRQYEVVEFARVGLRRDVACGQIELGEHVLLLIPRTPSRAVQQTLVRRRRADRAAHALRGERVVGRA